MYLTNHTAPQIQQKLGPAPQTIYQWSSDGHWDSLRKRATIDFEAEARHVVATAIVGLDKAVQCVTKLLSHIETSLDATTSQSGSEAPSRGSELCDVTELPSDKVAVKRSNLSPSDLATLAGSLKDVSDVLLRVFSK